jgi:hypothetical protein
MYHVGFGDCFLLTFHYGSKDRHLLMDFGTTRGSKEYMLDVARDIRHQTGGRLDAVVATHRHKDHISGFATADDTEEESPGSVVAQMEPKLVSMTWTEAPGLAKDATGPVRGDCSLSFVAALRSMERVAEKARTVAAAEKKARRFTVSSEMESLSEINISNKSAQRNLLSMSGRENSEFLHYRKRTRLNRTFYGVKFHVLGPPTADQSARVKSHVSTDEDEFWHLANYWSLVESAFLREGGKRDIPFTKNYREKRKPSHAKWLVEKMRDPTAADLLRISRVMDRAINNTSLILLIEVGRTKLLFPGDAQIESWDYVLNGPHAAKNRQLLSGVSVYKVGHHASLNGTPKTLWNLFQERKDIAEGGELVTLLSSRTDIHGKKQRGTEVPRGKLLEALKQGSTLIATPWDIDKKKKLRHVQSEVWQMQFA